MLIDVSCRSRYKKNGENRERVYCVARILRQGVRKKPSKGRRTKIRTPSGLRGKRKKEEGKVILSSSTAAISGTRHRWSRVGVGGGGGGGGGGGSIVKKKVQVSKTIFYKKGADAETEGKGSLRKRR